MTTKNATEALVELTKDNPEFRTALLEEILKGARTDDFTIDPFSQHLMLRNLRGGDLVEILFAPNPLHPQRIATRLVDSDYDPSIPGVMLKGMDTQELLVDRGQGQPLIWEPGEGEPAIPVIQLKIVKSQLKFGAEDEDTADRDKQATEILEALGGQQKLESHLGARNIQVLGKELVFSWPNRMASKGTNCSVLMLDEPGQCEILFRTKNASGVWEVVGRHTVPKTELVKTFEKQTGWFLQI